MTLATLLAIWLLLSVVLTILIVLLYRPNPKPSGLGYYDFLTREMDEAQEWGWLEPVEPSTLVLTSAIDPADFDPTDLTKGGGTFEITDLDGNPVPFTEDPDVIIGWPPR